jgi:hypothetical protein
MFIKRGHFKYLQVVVIILYSCAFMAQRRNYDEKLMACFVAGQGADYSHVGLACVVSSTSL